MDMDQATTRPRNLRAPRYLTSDPARRIATFIRNDLRYLDYEQTLKFYATAVPLLDKPARALLGCNDRYFLLTGLLGRRDALHPWLFDRVREVERDPDGYLDLWARFHYKSSAITFAGCIQEILVNPEIKIAIFSVVKPIAQEFLSQIKDEFESNETLKDLYSDVLYADPKKKNAIDGRPAKWGIVRGITVKRVANPKEGTLEAHGLIDGQPTSRHFDLQVYDDVVTQDYLSEDQIRKTTQRWEMADNLGSHLGVRKWVAGTHYHFCLPAQSQILMADWSHKAISEVEIGDEVVGWEIRGLRYLRRAKVLNKGALQQQPVNRYWLENGRSVICTETHQWWRGPHGGSAEYQYLRVSEGHRGLSRIRQLLKPCERDDSRDAGWLAGFFDGEGTVRKNTHHPSSVICFSQTTKNPTVIDEARAVFRRLGFKWSESWISAEGRERMTHDRCMFSIHGGWPERYRFLAQIAPSRRARIAETLYAAMQTDHLLITKVESAGVVDVHWLETETGNYIADGFCSKNSDTYMQLSERKSLKMRKYPATDDGTLNGTPVFLTPERWEEIKRDQRSTVSAQMLLNPIAGTEATFRSIWFKTYDVYPATMNVYIMVDPSKGSGERSDRTAICVIGLDGQSNKYLLDGFCHRMKLTERWNFTKMLQAKWERHPGVQAVKVGWERYGKDVELEVIEGIQEREKTYIAIEELNTPRQGKHSKDDRIGRLEPDIRGGRFYFPCLVHNPDAGGSDGTCYWKVWTEAEQKKFKDKAVAEDEPNRPVPYAIEQVVYWPARGPTKLQQWCANTGQRHRIVTPIKRRDENNDVYDLTRSCMLELMQHPFGQYKDLIDAASRIYDMEPCPPQQFEASAVEPLVEDRYGGESYYDA